MNLMPTLSRLGRALARQGMAALLDRSKQTSAHTDGGSAGRSQRAHSGNRRGQPADIPGQGYLGDWTGPVPVADWTPVDDGEPDPGEVVWAWVPFEEDHRQGKDRPVLVIARHPRQAGVFLALPLTSKDHDRDAAQEARAGRRWLDVGAGPWDTTGRPSEVRVNRVLQLRRSEIRRTGAALDERRYAEVLDAVR